MDITIDCVTFAVVGQILKLMSSLIWPLIFVMIAWRYRSQMDVLLQTLLLRVKSGSSLKIAAFEVGAVQVEAGIGLKSKHGRLVTTQEGVSEFREKRESFRQGDKTVFLVHRLWPSDDPEQVYDVLLYLVTAKKYGTLTAVKSVEYYLGPHWNNEVYEAAHRTSSFSLTTAAFYPFTATAKVFFVDGTITFVHRYIDFEMGPRG